MQLVAIRPSKKAEKRFTAFFKHKQVHFGSKNGSTFIDHRDTKKKRDYIARHRVNENWSKPDTPGTLSRYLLWEHPTLEDAVASFKRRFNV